MNYYKVETLLWQGFAVVLDFFNLSTNFTEVLNLIKVLDMIFRIEGT